MKNMKIMAVLAFFLAAVLFIGSASAATDLTVSNDISNPTEITSAGNYTLAYDNATVSGHYLPAGTTKFTVFDSLSPVTGNFTLAAANNGAYTQSELFPAVTYRLNYVSNASEVTENFKQVRSTTVYERNISANTPVNLRFPDNTFVPAGTAFTDGNNITASVDGSTGTIVGQASGVSLNYTIPASTVTYYLNINIGVGPTPGPYDRDVAAGTDAFVYEHIIVNGTQTAGTLTKFTDGQTPAVVNQISSDATGVFYLTEEVIGNNYGTYYLSAAWDSQAPYINIWYPELSIQAELTTNIATGATAGDSIDGKNVNKDTVVTFLFNAPKVGPAYYNATAGTGATAKIVFTTPVSGKTTQSGTVDYNNKLLTASQINADWITAGDDAIAGTYTAQAEYVSPSYFSDYDKVKVEKGAVTISASGDGSYYIGDELNSPEPTPTVPMCSCS